MNLRPLNKIGAVGRSSYWSDRVSLVKGRLTLPTATLENGRKVLNQIFFDLRLVRIDNIVFT